MRAHIYQMDLTPENIRPCFAPYESSRSQTSPGGRRNRYGRIMTSTMTQAPD